MIDSPFVLLGIGAAVSVLGFFIKRMKEEIDVLKAKNTRLRSIRQETTKRSTTLRRLLKTAVRISRGFMKCQGSSLRNEHIPELSQCYYVPLAYQFPPVFYRAFLDG